MLFGSNSIRLTPKEIVLLAEYFNICTGWLLSSAVKNAVMFYQDQYSLTFYLPTKNPAHKLGFSGFKKAAVLQIYEQQIRDEKVGLLSYMKSHCDFNTFHCTSKIQNNAMFLCGTT